MNITYLAAQLSEMIASGIDLDTAITTLEIHEGMTADETNEVLGIVF